MGAIAQSVVHAGAQPKPPSAWHHLRRLIPYVARYTAMTVLGLLTLGVMGLVGSLAPLIIGIIFDCLGRSPRALSNLEGTSRALLAPISTSIIRSAHIRWWRTA